MTQASCLQTVADQGRALLWGAALVVAVGSLWVIAWANSLDTWSLSAARSGPTPDRAPPALVASNAAVPPDGQ